jgi:esterase/lipase superfamily enzyme
MLCLIIASQLLLMSDRASFWDPDKIADHTRIVQESTRHTARLTTQDIQGKNVLLLVHGYNNNAKEALSTYRLINSNLSGPNYDYVIGYLWPGYEEALEYFKAKHHVPTLAKKMRSHLEFLSASAAKLDVLAHSMGNFLILEALNYDPLQKKKLVQNYFALAPAVDDESLEKREKYYPSTQNCENLFVFYSKGDEVLKWSYSFAEIDRALGYEGAEHPKRLPPNVHLINYSNSIGGHSAYFTFPPIYEFIKNQTLPKPN